MTPPETTTTSLSSTKIRFARRFLRSLGRVKRHSKASSDEEIVRRQSTRIKMAAYTCMASAVGSKRAWSRAVIFRLRKRARWINKRRWSGRRRMSRAGKLRELVPGGEDMDICRLLEETAHYVKCLAIQVDVMKTIADHLSAA